MPVTPSHPSIRERLADLLTPEFIIAMALMAMFIGAYIASPTAEMKGALIAGFSGGWGFYLGNANGQRRAQDQATDATALTAAAVRGLSAAFMGRPAGTQSQEVQEQ